MRHLSGLLIPACFVLASCEAEPVERHSTPRLTVEAGPGCGTVPTVGCCVGTTLLHCSGGYVKSESCAPLEHCGWSTAFGMYACGLSSDADPAGKFPRDCQGDLGLPKVDTTSAVDAAAGDAATTCGPLGYVGCCEGQVLYFCSGGQVFALDCTLQPFCGWNAPSGYYDCNTSGSAAPAAQHPMSCNLLLGDSGVKLDGTGALDAGLDQSPVDLSSDVGDAAPCDSFVAGDLPTRDGQGDGSRDGAGGDGAVGLDASGLDVSGRDGGSMVKPSGGGGCSGCAVQRTPSSPGGWLLLLVLVVLRRRRRCR